MSGPVTLTPEQLRQDFLTASPTQHYVSIITAEEENNEMGTQITIYDHETVLKFGKYKGTGLTVEDVATTDPKYLVWCHENIQWFALLEEIYEAVCILAGVKPDPKLLKKASQQSAEKPSTNGDLFDQDKDDVPF